MTPRQAGEIVELLTRLVLIGEATEQHLSRLVQVNEAIEAHLARRSDDDPTQDLELAPAPHPVAPGDVIRTDPPSTAPPTREENGHPRPTRRRSRPWA